MLGIVAFNFGSFITLLFIIKYILLSSISGIIVDILSSSAVESSLFLHLHTFHFSAGCSYDVLFDVVSACSVVWGYLCHLYFNIFIFWKRFLLTHLFHSFWLSFSFSARSFSYCSSCSWMKLVIHFCMAHLWLRSLFFLRFLFSFFLSYLFLSPSFSTLGVLFPF